MIVGRTVNYRMFRNPVAAHLARRSSPTRRLQQLLFSNGEQGVFYVPQPVVDGEQVLFTDDAGTIPVTADGDLVGRDEDLSGNGNHASQAVSLSRPKYRTGGVLHWLQPDGVDDTLASMSYGFTSNSWSVFASAGSISKFNIGVHVDPGNTFGTSERFLAGFDDGRYKIWSASKTAGSGDIIPNPSQPHVLGLVCDGSGQLHYYFDGHLAYSVTPSPAIDYSTSLKPGIVNSAASFPANPVHGIVAVDYDLGLFPDRLNQLTTYLANRAGITL